eukprot:gnl/TRDRNA2_/TRDRNA2_157156_c4_seq1.p2 gnl/TRDRNA2_/TRDRNA2_157156_c4~~gnl/TRDRNA2_/TRDRNA2_157156_c4_seq1.p2  ORF type:complete len:122 (+),score=6.13 gnl/TRDRNA2_/TRDRNA2_157156_c4_seq1:220-585(+)
MSTSQRESIKPADGILRKPTLATNRYTRCKQIQARLPSVHVWDGPKGGPDTRSPDHLQNVNSCGHREDERLAHQGSMRRTMLWSHAMLAARTCCGLMWLLFGGSFRNNNRCCNHSPCDFIY